MILGIASARNEWTGRYCYSVLSLRRRHNNAARYRFIRQLYPLTIDCCSSTFSLSYSKKKNYLIIIIFLIAREVFFVSASHAFRSDDFGITIFWICWIFIIQKKKFSKILSSKFQVTIVIENIATKITYFFQNGLETDWIYLLKKIMDQKFLINTDILLL